MKNTTENKGMFFAQYWGQKVLGQFDSITKIQQKQRFHVNGKYYKFGFLELKPLSSITDEDAREIATLALYDPSIEDWNPDEVWTGEGDMDSRGNHSLEIGMRCWTGVLNINDQTGTITLHDEDGEAQEIYNVSDVFDCLRVKGYAARWNGLSADQLVEYGWIKLKEA